MKNDGNVDVSNLKVTDALTGDKWTIETLQAGKSKVYTAKHTITEADARNGWVTNIVTATGKGPDGKPVTVVNGEATVAVRPLPARGGASMIGECFD